jgi:hypothetical protein
MTVEYSLTRSEIVQGFFRSLVNSRKYLATILLWGIALAVFGLVLDGAISYTPTSKDAVTAAEWFIGFLIFLPIWLFIRGKTSQRSLTISPNGIPTAIGSKTGKIPWRRIKTLAVTGQDLLVAGTGGNAFFIPNRAFSTPAHRADFLAQMALCKESSKTAQ